jgi:hypothetical protein
MQIEEPGKQSYLLCFCQMIFIKRVIGMREKVEKLIEEEQKQFTFEEKGRLPEPVHIKVNANGCAVGGQVTDLA